jgi:hypothetical protein
MLRADFSRRMMSYVAIAHRVSFVTYNNCARTMSFTTTKHLMSIDGGAAHRGRCAYRERVSGRCELEVNIIK